MRQPVIQVLVDAVQQLEDARQGELMQMQVDEQRQQDEHPMVDERGQLHRRRLLLIRPIVNPSVQQRRWELGRMGEVRTRCLANRLEDLDQMHGGQARAVRLPAGTARRVLQFAEQLARDAALIGEREAKDATAEIQRVDRRRQRAIVCDAVRIKRMSTRIRCGREATLILDQMQQSRSIQREQRWEGELGRRRKVGWDEGVLMRRRRCRVMVRWQVSRLSA
jgi:hypothetical protein